MIVSVILIVALLGAKINGVVSAPWWLLVVSSVVLLIVGMVTSGMLKVKVKVEKRSQN